MESELELEEDEEHPEVGEHPGAEMANVWAIIDLYMEWKSLSHLEEVAGCHRQVSVALVGRGQHIRYGRARELVVAGDIVHVLMQPRVD